MLIITSFTASVLAIMLVALSIYVGIYRNTAKIMVGTGNDEKLTIRIRAQGNFTEYAPMALIIIALCEYQKFSSTLVLILAALIIIGRLTHAIGMLKNLVIFKFIGMIGTYLCIIIGAISLIMGLV